MGDPLSRLMDGWQEHRRSERREEDEVSSVLREEELLREELLREEQMSAKQMREDKMKEILVVASEEQVRKRQEATLSKITHTHTLA